jgi:catalase
VNVDAALAQGVAEGLGFAVPAAMPSQSILPDPVFEPSPALSLLSRPGSTGIKARRIAVIVFDGVDGNAALRIYDRLLGEGAVPRFVGIRLGQVNAAQGSPLAVDISMEAGPPCLYDGLIIPAGDSSALHASGQALDFIRDQYRHCKPILLLGAAVKLADTAGIKQELPDGEVDDALLTRLPDQQDEALAAFIDKLAAHRDFRRETDPPLV